MKLLVGLGNPGADYKLTRHNLGFMLIDYLAAGWGIKLEERKYGACWGRGAIAGQEVALVQPLSYMNLSGQPVKRLLRAFGLDLADLLVACDDLNLPLGRLRLRSRGSAGGHNGLKSIITSLQSAEFPRLRLGIGQPPPGQDAAEYVLSPFKIKEWPLVEEMLSRAGRALETCLAEGLQAAMNTFN